MADIINFQEIKDIEEETFAIRQDDGELKPMELWNGEDWRTLFEGPMTIMAQGTGRSPWDMFAEFMGSILSEECEE